jgi:hypothetical protein
MNESTIARKPAVDNSKKIEKPKFYDKVVSLTVEESPFNLKERTIAIILQKQTLLP